MLRLFKFKNNIFLIFFVYTIIFGLTNCHLFQKKKVNVTISELLKEHYEHANLGKPDDCLVPVEDAKKILREKYKLNPDIIDVDENIRFILGKCNPIIYVPGLYASRLTATINCKVLKKNFLEFVKMRLYCGNTICADEESTYEEHVLFPAIFDTPFQIRVNDKINKYTACQAYFYNFYNSRKECPENNCYYDDGIRISFYGGTKKTKEKSRCGIKSQEDLVYAGEMLPPIITNQLISANFYVMIQHFRSLGYRDGFSQGGVPFDYRRYFTTNKLFEEAFEYQINRLYRNTGKKVIVITHSLGGLLSLTSLVSNPELKNKIKAYVPIVPPYAGASHLLEAYLYGLTDINTEINIINFMKLEFKLSFFSQSLYFNSAPIVGELRPQEGLVKVLKQPEYQKMKKALEELFAVEKECGYQNCPDDKILEMTKTYREVYGDDFPSLADEDCKLTDEELKAINNVKNSSLNFTRKCLMNVYNILDCPILAYEKDFQHNITNEELKKLCGIFNSSLLYIEEHQTCKPKTYKEIFGWGKFLHEKNKEKKTELDSLFFGNGKFPYSYKEFDELLKEYNEKYSVKYGKVLTLDDFESKEEFMHKAKRNIEHSYNTSLIKDLPIPPVDTYLIFGSFKKTENAYSYDNQNKTKEVFDQEEILRMGGDNTVPNYSSFLTGMKWLYEKKMNNLPQTIKLIEYCSLVSKEGNKYAYNNETFKDKIFVGLNCDCLNPDFKSYNDNDCTHSAIPHDSYLNLFIQNEIAYDENNLNIFSEEKRKAIKRYDKKFDYEQTCNEALYLINKDDMDQVDWF